MMTSSFVSPSAAAFWVVGDYIGMESCFDLYNNEQVGGGGGGGALERKLEVQLCTRMMMKRELPPPLPSLARPENQPSHMPWMLKRYYTNDGRLILKEEKVKHHEYFRAHRSNGRLTLHLIPLDDIDEIDDIEDNDTYHEETKEEDDHHSGDIVDTLLRGNNIEDSVVKFSIAESNS